MTYILYGDKGSGAFCVEAALAEAGATYQFHAVSLEKSEQKSPAFLAINPSGKLPALRLPEGGIVTETAALLLSIAERYPQAALLPPPATVERAQAYRWIAFMASEIYPMVEIVDYPERFVPQGEQAEALRENVRERVRERLLTVERTIVGPWFLPGGYSVVDIYAVMFSRWSIGKNWREENLPRINTLAEALARRPAIAPVWARHFGG